MLLKKSYFIKILHHISHSGMRVECRKHERKVGPGARFCLEREHTVKVEDKANSMHMCALCKL